MFPDSSGCVFGGALIGWLGGAVFGGGWSVAGVLSGAVAGLLLWLVVRLVRR